MNDNELVKTYSNVYVNHNKETGYLYINADVTVTKPGSDFVEILEDQNLIVLPMTDFDANQMLYTIKISQEAVMDIVKQYGK